ncbi:MAG: hypothetical protein Q7S09_04130 [bacterium]|nr:hypothetical protein [bacterium]
MSEIQSGLNLFSNAKKAWLAAIAILIFGVLLQQYFKRTGGSFPGPSASPGSDAPQERILVKVNTDGWKEYLNEKLGFSVKYPESVSLRGQAESDFAILTLSRDETEGKQSLITLTRKKIPLGREPYASMEEFWKDEQENITANSGVVSGMRYVQVNDRIFWEAREDNRQINYMGLHRYLKITSGVYEVGLNVEGEKLFQSAVDRYNQILSTLTLNGE